MGILGLIVLLLIALVNVQPFFVSLVSFVIAVLFWMIIGSFAGQIIRGRGYSALGNAALGLVGGILGTMVLRTLGMGGIMGITLVGGIIAGVIGAVLFVYLMRWTVDKQFAK